MSTEPEKGTGKKSAQSAATSVFSLPAILTIQTVSDVANALRQADFKEDTTFVVDASLVEVITTPGIQLLLSLSSALQRKNGQLKVVNAGEAFV